jgi:magnesium chelatase subunit I
MTKSETAFLYRGDAETLNHDQSKGGEGSNGSSVVGRRSDAVRASGLINEVLEQQPAAGAFPFSAIVGQDEMKLALLISAVDPTVGGVLAMGDRGTGKSTAVRALASLLPMIDVFSNCPYGCDPSSAPEARCDICANTSPRGSPRKHRKPVPMVELPLGATEDCVLGSLDLERALTEGVKAFQPGLLARANRGYLYIDEVNLLEDHLVDLLIDVSACGVNTVERDGLSVRHPARFVLVGSGNPEEGELRPQLLDRFGLCVEVQTPTDISSRVEVVKRRDAYERGPIRFASAWSSQEESVRADIVSARARLATVDVPDRILESAARLCLSLGTDGLRGELTLVRAARALASLQGAQTVGIDHLRSVAPPSLRHRLRRNPLDEAGSTARIERAMAEHLAL